MNRKFTTRKWLGVIALGILGIHAPVGAYAQAGAQATAPPGTQALPQRVTLDEAIDLALKHNHPRLRHRCPNALEPRIGL